MASKLRALGRVIGLLATLPLNATADDNALPRSAVKEGFLGQQSEYPECQVGTSEYVRGLCCFHNDPTRECPNPVSDGAGDPPNNPASPSAPPVASEATFITSQITLSDDTVATAVVLSGGPISSAVTLSSVPTSLAADSPEVTRLLADISSGFAGTVVPSVSAALSGSPEASIAAIAAIKDIVPQVAELANGLANGDAAIFDCLMEEEEEHEEGGQGAPDKNIAVLENKFRSMTCELLGLLERLEYGVTDVSTELLMVDLDDLLGIAGIESPSDGPGSSGPPVDIPTTSTTNNLTEPTESTAADATDSTDAAAGASTDSMDSTTSDTTDSTTDSASGSLINTPSSSTEEVDEALITSTITELPAEASLETITNDVTYTENTIITTTREDDEEETIVPIFVIPGGSAMICWRCVVDFPANLQIKIKELCVNILGFKIGPCPPVEPPNTNNDPPENDQSSRPTSEPTSSETTSCSTTMTATYVSIFCTVTTTTEPGQQPGAGGEQEVTKGCSTLEYSTVTSCEVTGSTTTVTSTELSQPVHTLCSSENCGESCGLDTEEDSSEFAIRAPGQGLWWMTGPSQKRSRGKRIDPDEHFRGDKDMYMRYMAQYGYHYKRLDPLIIPVVPRYYEGGGKRLAYGQELQWGKEPKALVLRPITGCTIISVVSRIGAFIGVISETALDAEIGAFINGQGKGDLGQLRANPNHPDDITEELDVNDIRRKGFMFNNDRDPQIFVVARKGVNTLQQDGSQMVDVGAPNLGNIYNWLNFLFPGHTITSTTFDPLDMEVYGQSTLPKEFFFMSKNKPRGDKETDPKYFTGRGKMIVDYEAAHCSAGRSEASWRVYAENEQHGITELGSSSFIPVHMEQYFGTPPPPIPQLVPQDEWDQWQGALADVAQQAGGSILADGVPMNFDNIEADQAFWYSDSPPPANLDPNNFPPENVIFSGTEAGAVNLADPSLADIYSNDDAGPSNWNVNIFDPLDPGIMDMDLQDVLNDYFANQPQRKQRRADGQACLLQLQTAIHTHTSEVPESTDSPENTSVDAPENTSTNLPKGGEGTGAQGQENCQTSRQCTKECKDGFQAACENGLCNRKEQTPEEEPQGLICVASIDCNAMECERGQGRSCERNKCRCVSPYQTGTCNLRILQYVVQERFEAALRFSDDAGAEIGSWASSNPLEVRISETKVTYYLRNSMI